MRVSLNWLKDYLEIKPDQEVSQLNEALIMAGLEVEHIDNIKLKAQKMPLAMIENIIEDNKEKSLYKAKLANGSVIHVLGPSELANKTIVALAPCDINSKSNYEVASFAMLGLAMGQDDFIILDLWLVAENWPDNLAMINHFDDIIFTLAVAPNRSDALSHLGISRELSALLELNTKLPMLTPKEMAGLTHERVAIEIEDANDCPRYACRILENINIAPSPWWLKLRLLSIGIRPINNVVDVTNYVMISRGQPLHAFDYDTLNQENGRAKILVRRAFDNEKIILLDGKEITLDPHDMVIADHTKALALAGVMGGQSSAVTSKTTTVLLESAYFSPANIRHSSRKHKIISESSYRFERGLDPNGVMDALNYAARLLSEISQARVCREAIDAYRKRIDPIEIKMRPDRAQAILGIDNFDQDLIRKKFLRLGIETIAKRGDDIYFRVPTYRTDLTREIDLIEEAIRMLGYDKVAESHYGFSKANNFVYDEESSRVINKISQALIAKGFFEAINYSFLSKELQDLFIDNEEAIKLKNPISERYAFLRQSLIPGLVKNLIHNQNNQENSIQLFEIGTVFLGKNPLGLKPDPDKLSHLLNEDSFLHEKKMLSFLIAGKDSLLAFDEVTKPFDFYAVKGIITELFAFLGIRVKNPWSDIVFSSSVVKPFLHPGESVNISYQANDGQLKCLGYAGRLHPEIAFALAIDLDTFVVEINLDDLITLSSKLSYYQPFSRYPVIERDVAFVVDEEVKAGDLLALVEKVDGADTILHDIKLFDLYRGSNIGDGKKSLAINISLQHPQRTLTDEEASNFINQWIELTKIFNAKIR